MSALHVATMQNGTRRHILSPAFVFQVACSDDDGREAVGGACTTHEDCVLVSRDCCGGEDNTLQNTYASRRSGEGNLTLAPSCRGKTASCPSYEPPVFNPLGPKLRAACIAGECTAVDVRADAISACSQDSQCGARGAGCCPACQRLNIASYLAVNTQADNTLLACFPIQPCPECAEPPLPAAYCANDGHCALRP